MGISYMLVNESKGKPNVLHIGNTYEFQYPCESRSDCTDYEVILPKGLYTFEAYGASGGIPSMDHCSAYIDPITNKCNQTIVDFFRGNAKCDPSKYSSGPGGYVSSVLHIDKPIKAFIMIGGQGTYKTQSYSGNGFDRKVYIPGGYGGGGPARPYYTNEVATASGGGRTALMLLEDDIFHSVLVAGAGGGSDDYTTNNDGKAGAGGGISAQSFWIQGKYNPDFESNSSHFFTYGNGEAVVQGRSKHPKGSVLVPSSESQYSGAGGGWFGGFASYHYNGGSGGGSSFALTKNAEIPSSMTVYDNFYENPITASYEFTKTSKFLMTDVVHAPGIWFGNGLFRITVNSITNIGCNDLSCQFTSYNLLYSILRANLYLEINYSL